MSRAKHCKVRSLTASDVECTVRIEPEEIPFRGNASAIDDETDAETEAWIARELSRGNDAAWCCVIVEATWKSYSGVASVGGCSYATEAEALACADDYGLQAEALEDLNRSIASIAAELSELAE